MKLKNTLNYKGYSTKTIFKVLHPNFPKKKKNQICCYCSQLA